MGVWIETSYELTVETDMEVTPFVGVWIETRVLIVDLDAQVVTPFVGVWIETGNQPQVMLTYASHTLRGCVD